MDMARQEALWALFIDACPADPWPHCAWEPTCRRGTWTSWACCCSVATPWAMAWRC